MAPDTPAREPEMQDTPPCRCPKSGDAVRISAFFVSDLGTFVRRNIIIKHLFYIFNLSHSTKFRLEISAAAFCVRPIYRTVFVV